MSIASSAGVLKLKSSDGEIFEVKETVAVQSEVIKQMVEGGCTGGDIPLYGVTGWTLSMVLEWCNKHQNKDDVEKEKLIKKWEKEFMDMMSLEDLYWVMTAANYLNIKTLLDCCCQKVADTVKGKSPEQIRTEFGIKNDFTPDEEKAIKEENSWAFD